MLNWLRYQVRKLLRPRVIANGGVRIDLGPVAGTRYARALYRDSHERDEREIVAGQLRSSDTVLELGAGLGLVTVLCCQRVGGGRVHAFEANAALEPALRRNCELNDVQPQLHFQMVALDGGPQAFHISDRFVQSSRVAAPGGPVASRQVEVEAVAWSDVLREVQPTFLIADIEGGELDLADPGVDLSSVQKLCLEMHPHLIGDDGVSRVLASLLARGFALRLSESRGQVLFFERPAAQSSASVLAGAA